MRKDQKGQILEVIGLGNDKNVSTTENRPRYNIFLLLREAFGVRKSSFALP